MFRSPKIQYKSNNRTNWSSKSKINNNSKSDKITSIHIKNSI